MMGPDIGRPVQLDHAVDWVRGSLARGSDLARLVTQQLSHLTTARVLTAPYRLQGVELLLDDFGRNIPSSDADDVARQFLRELTGQHEMTLVVEDDLGRRGDPKVGRVAFVDDRIVRWEDIDRASGDAANLLRAGASGYPLNAFVCRGRAPELSLEPDRELGVVERERIARSTCAVIVSVWDAEAYVALVSPDLACSGA